MEKDQGYSPRYQGDITDENYGVAQIEGSVQNSFLQTSKEIGIKPTELAHKIHKNLPEGGIAVQGGTASKVRSIQKEGFDPAKAQLFGTELGRFNTYFIASKDLQGAAVYEGREKQKERVRDFLSALETASQWSVNRSIIGTEQRLYSRHRPLPMDYGRLGRMIEDGSEALIEQFDFPGTTIFTSTDSLRLNQLRRDPDVLESKHVMTVEERNVPIPPKNVAASIVLTREDFVDPWVRSKHLVDKIMRDLPFQTTAQVKRFLENGETLGEKYSSTILTHIRNGLEDANLGESQFERRWEFLFGEFKKALHLQLFCDGVKEVMVKKIVLELYSLYGNG